VTSGNDLSGTAFSDVDGTGYASSFVAYLDEAKKQFATVKCASYSLLRLQPNDKVLDVGCGTGDDVREISALVGATGMAVGVDKSEAMIAEARRRSAGCSLPLQFQVSDAEHLPWESNTFDACRVDRLLQHVPYPERVFQELCRVLKHGGRLVIADRDWGMVALDSSDEITTRIVLDRAAAGIRNNWIGRRLQALFKMADLKGIGVQTHCINISSLEIADTLLDLRMVAEHAISACDLTRQAVDAWLNDLSTRDRLGTFLATVTMFIVSGVKS
jgi:SAM-dependent methyltransferase